MRQLGQVEATQQMTAYSCGSATLKAVLKHWGLDVDEPTLADLVGVDAKTGSTAHQVEDAAKKLDFQAMTITFDNVDELAPFLKSGVPVIMAIQSFNRPDQGHFVVGTEIDDSSVRIMDPNVRGNWRVLSKPETAQRWKFRDNVGIVIVPKSGFGDPYASRKARNRLLYGHRRHLTEQSSLRNDYLLIGLVGVAVIGAVWWSSSRSSSKARR